MAKFEFSQWLFDWFFSQNDFLFEWDKGNQTKSKTKHDVDTMEAQQVFVDGNKVPLGIQVEPIVPEPRFGIIGQTESGRILHVVFAVRGGKTRVISARTAHKKERLFYEKTLREER